MKRTSHHLRPWIAAAIALFTFDTARQLPAASAILTGDTYTDANKPGKNYGDTGILKVAGSGAALKRVWIKFDLPSVLPAGTTAAQISKATLKLWVNNVKTAGPVSGYVVTGPSWVEGTGAAGSGMTNNTAPAVEATALFTEWQITSEGNYAAVDLTSLVQSWVAGSAPNYGIALVPGSSTVDVSFDSKESTTTSHGPQLEIELVNQGPAGPVGPQGTQGLKGATGAVGPIGPQGLAGAIGPMGPQGPMGLMGPQGFIGPMGLMGPMGFTGRQGAVGPMGPVGPEGSQGSQGSQGPQGPQGPQGDSFWQRQGNLIYLETGSLGLGTTNPAYRLDVRGDSKITGDLILTGKIIIPKQGDISMGEVTAP